MATGNTADDLAEDLFCCVCLDLFKEPVILECGHNFCKSCIDEVWDSEKTPSCPECREEFPAKKYTINRLLSKMVDKVQKVQQCEKARKPHQEQKCHCALESQQCLEHKEALKLFCQEDEIAICALCVVSPKHSDHSFLSLQEGISRLRDKLTEDSSLLESRLKDIKGLQNEQEQNILEMQTKTLSLEQHITSEFAKLHQLLQDKEQNLIQQLKEEAAGILGKMEENLSDIKCRCSIIQDQLSDIQLKMQLEDPLNFLMVFRDTKEIYVKPQTEDVLPDIVFANCDVSREMYNYFLHHGDWNEWKSIMRTVPASLTLNPDTAHCSLVLSEDLTMVRWNYTQQQLSDNPERFEIYACVLGREGFTSGRHYWEVVVNNMKGWNVGVTKESSYRKGKFSASQENGYWTLSLTNGNKFQVNSSPLVDLSLTLKPERIGIYLDVEGGEVSFYNASNMSQLYTITDTFTERLHPYFYVGGNLDEQLTLFHLKM